VFTSHGGKGALSTIARKIRAEEGNPDLSYQTVYVAILMENQRLDQLGERTKFITSREGERRGWVRLREESDVAQGADELEARIKEKNESVGEEIRGWLQQMDWRTFESTFLQKVLDALGFQDVQITPPTHDGGADARVTYHRGMVEARALVSAKR
jgi:Restriction endonuclease